MDKKRQPLVNNSLKRWIDIHLCKPLVTWLWKEFEPLTEKDLQYWYILKRYFITQKIFRINGPVPWPVDFRSQVVDWQSISKDKKSYPGGSMGNYINAKGGLSLGTNVLIGPNTVISTTNHSISNPLNDGEKAGVVIGNNVWIASNCTIVAGANIGNNVTIGAGCYINNYIPDNTLVKQDKNNIILIPKK
ncbi:MAG: acetyltransferase-like isoleucine patch superfamily enzyme [Bacteroidia bacterium]